MENYEVTEQVVETVPEQATELATVDTARQGNVIAQSTFGANVNKATVFNAFNDSKSLAKDGPDTITLAGIMCVEGVGQDGLPCTNTYIIADDGTSYFTQSAGIARSCKQLLSLYAGDVAGLVVRVVEQDLGGGRTVKNLRIVD